MNDSTTASSDRTPSDRADVCIVGSGPAGSLVAYTLAERGYDVVVLEAGERFDFESRLERMERSLRPAHYETSIWNMGGARDAFTSSGEAFYPLNQRRVKGVGGSTLHWGGRVARLPEKDFEMRSRYGLAADWPIDYSDLRPYYVEAERELGVAGDDDNPFAASREEPYPMDAFPPSYSDRLLGAACDELGITVHSAPSARNAEPYDGRSPCVGYSTCSPVCPSGAKYSADVHVAKAETHGARIIDQATVQRLAHDDAGDRITAAVYRTPDGATHRQRADQFVVAGGGIETPRLLLLSASSAHPDGLANSSGAVGRYLMEAIYVGVVGELAVPTRQHRIGFGTTESYEFYEPDDVPPGSFKIEFGNTAGPTPVGLALEQRSPLSDLQELASAPTDSERLSALERDTKPIQWGDDLLRTIDENFGNHFNIVAEVEVLPHAENNVSLDTSETDPFGNPIPDVSWGYTTEYEEQTIDRAFEVIEQIVSNLPVDVEWAERFEYRGGASHPSGTTRMGTDPTESVVDPNLRTHDVRNLHVVGSSTFTTRGASQPTLTIAALALRLGDHLAENVL